MPLVLVVDDVADNRDMYAEYLRFSGFRAETASTSAEALAKARRDPPEVVVMDLSMPGLDGVEATRRLKADPRTSAARVLVVTGHALPDQLEAARAAGADAVAIKPCLPIDLLKQVQALLHEPTTDVRPHVGPPPADPDSPATKTGKRRKVRS